MNSIWDRLEEYAHYFADQNPDTLPRTLREAATRGRQLAAQHAAMKTVLDGHGWTQLAEYNRRLQERIAALEALLRGLIGEIRAECGQENCDGEPWDTFQDIADRGDDRVQEALKGEQNAS